MAVQTSYSANSSEIPKFQLLGEQDGYKFYKEDDYNYWLDIPKEIHMKDGGLTNVLKNGMRRVLSFGVIGHTYESCIGSDYYVEAYRGLVTYPKRFKTAKWHRHGTNAHPWGSIRIKNSKLNSLLDRMDFEPVESPEAAFYIECYPSRVVSQLDGVFRIY